MQCPKCQKENTRVFDTRTFGEQTKRQRVCRSCGGVFTTYEKAEEKTIVTKNTHVRRVK